MIFFQGGMTPSASPFVLHQNHLAAPGVTITAHSTAAGFDPSSVAAENTYQAWKGGLLQTFIQADAGKVVSVDTLALAAHNLGSTTGGVAFGYKLNAGDPFTYLSGHLLPSDDAPLALLLSSSVSGRYFIANTWTTPAPSAPPCIGVWSIGQRLSFPGWLAPDFTRPADAMVIEAQPSLSLEGHYLGTINRRKAGRLSPRLSPLPRAWVDANLAAFRSYYDEARPFFFAPGPAAFADDLVYAWRGAGTPELRPVILSGGRAVSIGMELDFHAA